MEEIEELKEIRNLGDNQARGDTLGTGLGLVILTPSSGVSELRRFSYEFRNYIHSQEGEEVRNIPVFGIMRHLSEFIQTGFLKGPLGLYIYRQVLGRGRPGGEQRLDQIIDLVWDFYSQSSPWVAMLTLPWKRQREGNPLKYL